MFAALLSRPTLQVVLQEDQVYVLPNHFHPDSPALEKDPVLAGVCHLTLPQPRAVSKLKVVLEGLSQVQGGDDQPYESTTTLHKELEIEIDETLDAGTHSFTFSFLIPRNTPKHQRSRYGKVRHFVQASANFPGTFSSSVKSDEVRVFVLATTTAPGAGFPPTDLSLQVLSEDLGPVGVAFFSPHLTPASLLSCQVTLLASPPGPGITIVSIKVIVTQMHEVHYPISGEVVVPAEKRVILRRISVDPPTSPPQSTSRRITRTEIFSGKSHDINPTHNRFIADPYPLAEVEPSSVWHHAAMYRVPDGAFLRPTTPESDTEEPVVIKHLLSTEIRYALARSNREESFTINKAVTLSHCSELADTFLLPTYEGPADADTPRGHGGSGNSGCNCMVPLEVMIGRDRAAFQRGRTTSTQPSAEAIQAARNKTPSSFHEGP